MIELKRFIDVHVPVSVCNFKCHYCYVADSNMFNTEKIKYEYSPEVVKKALTKARLGGMCHFNICGLGETLLSKDLVDYVKAILENGHSVMIVTNGVLTDRISDYMKLPKELKSRLGFKFSFHYLELKRTNMMETFFSNVKLAKENGCSISVELTPNDEYEPYIDDIKKLCIENLGALCHVSVPRDEKTGGIHLLSKHSVDEFNNIWKSFNSPMFNFKIRHWEEKRNEFCYAGMWSGLLLLSNGTFSPCYCQRGYNQNIFKNPEEKIKFYPVGKCKVAHCYNAHSFLTMGDIVSINEERYADIRDRVSITGESWLNPIMKEQFNMRLQDFNKQLSNKEKRKYKLSREYLFLSNVVKKVTGYAK